MHVKRFVIYLIGLMLLLFVSIAFARAGPQSAVVDQVDQTSAQRSASSDPVLDNAQAMITAGRQTFRFDTFGDEAFWGDTLRLHEAIEGADLGGVGPGVSPRAALAAGLKVDMVL